MVEASVSKTAETFLKCIGDQTHIYIDGSITTLTENVWCILSCSSSLLLSSIESSDSNVYEPYTRALLKPDSSEGRDG